MENPSGEGRRKAAARGADRAMPGWKPVVSVFWDHPAAGEWAESSDRELKLLVIFHAAECTILWRTVDGQRKEIRIGEGEICLIGPNMLHSGSWRSPSKLLQIRVEAAFAEEIGGAKFDGVAVHQIETLAREDSLLREVAAALRNAGPNPTRVQASYLNSLGIVFAVHTLKAHFKNSSVATKKQGLSPNRLQRATDFIETHMKDSFSVDEVAQAVFLSPFHFIRLFKNSTGLTPHQYLIRCRVMRAQDLLRTGNFRVAEVAHEVGFCDQSHLDRHFRRHFGYPPAVLLKQHV